jgi:hypothetical protein
VRKIAAVGGWDAAGLIPDRGFQIEVPYELAEVEVTWANPSPILLAEIPILCNGGLFVKTPGISAVPSM